MQKYWFYYTLTLYHTHEKHYHFTLKKRTADTYTRTVHLSDFPNHLREKILVIIFASILFRKSHFHLYYFHNITASYIYHIKKSEATLICPKNHRD